jgi:cysteine-rich repeat protein
VKRVALALCVLLSVVMIGCGDNINPGGDGEEDCALPGDEDGNGKSDCADPACASAKECQAACGNGKVEAMEACDDGNATDGDGCDNNCTTTGCGNGVQTMNEGCDDGNPTDGDGCDSNCMVTGCGNGIPTSGEACDDGNATSGDGCDNNCTVTACGNGVPTMGEECDDGNATEGDSCDSNCTTPRCGNGVPSMGEACDDGNATEGDGCDSNCTMSACGNGIPAPDEACDDGDLEDGDGCDSNCTMTGCGNGVPTTGEACDDGNGTNGDGCDVNCTMSACGNGVQAPDEACDDGNPTELDGCSALCVVEPLEQEPNEDGTPSTGGTGINGNDFGTAFPDANGAFTGDVVILAALAPVGDEDVFVFRNTTSQTQAVKFDIWNRARGRGVSCGSTIDTALHVRNAAGTSLKSNDDRNTTNDFCSALVYGILPNESVYVHVLEPGDNNLIAAYALEATYKGVVCGDDVVDPGETCDDGNAADGDGCSALCLLELSSEAEPNNTLPEATANVVQITGDTTIQASLKPVADVDVYRVTVATPTVIRFETLTSLYECVAATIDLRLFNSSGGAIVTDTVGSGISQCGAIVVFLDAGTYFISVEERGNNLAISDYVLQVDYQTARGAESEPATATGVNDTPATADRSMLGRDNTFVFGNHLLYDDADVYAITVPPGGRIRAEVVEGDRAAETCESLGIDSRLTLFDQNGVQLVDDDVAGRGYCSLLDGSGTTPLDPAARNASAETQTYYLMVRRSTFASTAGGTFVYRLQVTIR